MEHLNSVDILRRLSVLESLLGIDGPVHDKATTSTITAPKSFISEDNASASTSTDSSPTRTSVPIDISHRIDKLSMSINSLCSSQNTLMMQSSLFDQISVCESFAKELDPSGLLLATSNTPTNISEESFLYRRQELLSRQDDLQHAFHQLALIRDLLTISNPNLIKALLPQGVAEDGEKELGRGIPLSSELLEHSILSAPILSSHLFEFSSRVTNIQRLQVVTHELMELQDQIIQLAQRADTVIETYYTIICTVNEKILLFHEALDRLEHVKKRP